MNQVPVFNGDIVFEKMTTPGLQIKRSSEHQTFYIRLLPFQKTSDDNALVPSSEININQNITSENSCLNSRSSANGHPTETNNESYLETPQNTTEAFPGVYHVLQEKEEDQRDPESSDILEKTEENEANKLQFIVLFAIYIQYNASLLSLLLECQTDRPNDTSAN